MPYNSAYSLIDSSASLEPVPLLAIDLEVRLLLLLDVQVFLLLYDSWIIHAWVGYSNDEYGSSCIIHEVNTLAELSSAHAEEHSPAAFLDPLQVPLEANLKVFGSLGFVEHVTLEFDRRIVPSINHELHGLVRWEEKQNSARDVHLHSLDQLA